MFGGGDKATISALRSELADKDAQIETLKVCSYFFFAFSFNLSKVQVKKNFCWQNY